MLELYSISSSRNKVPRVKVGQIGDIHPFLSRCFIRLRHGKGRMGKSLMKLRIYFENCQGAEVALQHLFRVLEEWKLY